MTERAGPGGDPVEPEYDIARVTQRRTALVLLLALAVLGAVTLATKWNDIRWSSSKRSYCWGAWQEGGSPGVLGDKLVEGDSFARSGKESTPPARGERARCSVRITTKVERSKDPYESDPLTTADTSETSEAQEESQKTEEYQRVSAEFRPVPRGEAQRRSWLAEFLEAKAAPLPEGLPGVVGKDRGMLVLPDECDSGGLPSVVTVRGGGDMRTIGSEQDTADLLLSVANTAREEAGCAGEKPLRITAPLRGADREKGFFPVASTCGIPGFRLNMGRYDHYDVTATVTAASGGSASRLQTCSIDDADSVRTATSGGQFVMTSQPRLAALFDGLPGGDASPGEGWRGKGTIRAGRGLVTAECRGRPTVFYLSLDDYLAKIAAPDSRRVFARTVNSVADRIGCPAVAPGS